MRIIYFFGRLNDETEQSYLDVCGKMFPYGYYEIVPYDMYERGFRSKIAEILETPLTGEDVKKLIADRQEEKIHTEILMQSIEKIIDTTPVSFAKDEVEAGYDDTQVERFDEPQELLTEKQGEHITIAIGTISEKQHYDCDRHHFRKAGRMYTNRIGNGCTAYEVKTICCCFFGG